MVCVPRDRHKKLSLQPKVMLLSKGHWRCPALPPEATVMLGPLLPPRTMSGCVVLLQLRSVLTTEGSAGVRGL